MKNTILSFVSGTLLFVFGLCTGLVATPPKEPEIIYIQKSDIPSAREIQRRLKELDNPRYDPGKIDGIPGPNTLEGWNNYTCDQYAIRDVEGE